MKAIDHQTVTDLAEELGYWGTCFSDYRLNTMTTTPGFRRILDLESSVASLSLDDFFEHIHPDDRANYIATRNLTIHQHMPFSMNFRIVVANGGVRHVKTLMRFTYDLQENSSYGTGIIMDLTEMEETAAQALPLSDSDWLTGLPNRTAFFKNLEKSIEAARERHKRVGLLVINIDQLGKTNDAIGHARFAKKVRSVLSIFSQCFRRRIWIHAWRPIRT